jgi:hypothetical protein
MNIVFKRLTEYTKRIRSPKPSSCDTMENSNAVDQARIDWINAKVYFDQVVDPDLIEQAAYVVKATEKRYMYLLKQSKRRMTSINNVDFISEACHL